MKAIALQKNGVVTYRFDVEEEDDYVIRTALIPTQPNDNGDLRFSVGIDGQEPTVYSLKNHSARSAGKRMSLMAKPCVTRRLISQKGVTP